MSKTKLNIILQIFKKIVDTRLHSEAFLKPCQTSKMDLFAKIVSS